MDIRIGSISEPQVRDLLGEHRASMYEYSPPGSIHALTTQELEDSTITLWCAWDGEEMLGCGALKILDPFHGEIKSMRTATAHLRKGVASALLDEIVREAARRGIKRLSLETGSHEAFVPAQELYKKFGFEYCGPFPPYVEDPFSVFMTKEL